MFLLGLMSLFQICWLPGYLFLTFLKFKGTFINKYLLSFAISLIINYLLVSLLVGLGLYKRSLFLVFFAIELSILIKIKIHSLKEIINISAYNYLSAKLTRFYKICMDFISKKDDSTCSQEKFFRTLILSLSICVILFIFIKSVRNLGSIFDALDVVISWNRWAMDIFGGKFPHQTWHYPQLLPANWSISYLFIYSKQQFYVKAMMPLFFINTLIAIFDLALMKKSSSYMAGIFLFLLVCYVYHIKFVDGLADLPVAFMVFLAVYCLIIANQRRDNKETYAFLLWECWLLVELPLPNRLVFIFLLFFHFLSIFL
jgi:hypothetical protein